jgi:Protein phosphatase 2C
MEITYRPQAEYAAGAAAHPKSRGQPSVATRKQTLYQVNNRQVDQCQFSNPHFMSTLFILRGGDFHQRQAAGEHPKQLNYSRAFGGKDLKMYGLIAEPDISHFEIMPEDKLVLIASDGTYYVPSIRMYAKKLILLLPLTLLSLVIRAVGCTEPESRL